MTAIEVLDALSACGVRVVLGAGGRPEAEIAGKPAPIIEALLNEARAHRYEITEELRRNAPACPQCGVAVTPELVLCRSCFFASRGAGRVLPFDPDVRRRRTVARLADQPCGNCGYTNWQVTDRGDAVCQICAESRRERS